MARLKSLKPSAAALAPRLGYQPGNERERDRQRSAQLPWRAWYKTARWQKLAMQVFIRDNYTCQRTGVILPFKAPHPQSPVAHHKIPHRGDPALFWDIDNVECVAKSWHDGEGQRIEKGWGGGQKSTAA